MMIQLNHHQVNIVSLEQLMTGIDILPGLGLTSLGSWLGPGAEMFFQIFVYQSFTNLLNYMRNFIISFIQVIQMILKFFAMFWKQIDNWE